MRTYSPQRSLDIKSLWTSRIFLCSLSHNQVFFFFGITNEAVVNDAVINPSQMNAYVHIQFLSHTNTCIIPENPIDLIIELD